MSRITGFNRKRVGYRNYSALIESPPISTDEYGQVSYTSGTWTTVLADWWCELVDAGGGDIVDGLQTKASTQAVLVGDAPSTGGQITTDCRVTINGIVYGIVAVRDISGSNRVLRIEVRDTK